MGDKNATLLKCEKKGIKISEICRAYGVGKSAVFSLLKQERETGDITPKTHLRGRKPGMDVGEILKLKELDAGVSSYLKESNENARKEFVE